jgi:hypothetical protein
MTKSIRDYSLQWVDELNPPVKVTYDEINQRLQFTVDRTVLGTGTDSNFNSFTIYGKGTATDTNNLGLVSNQCTWRVILRNKTQIVGICSCAFTVNSEGVKITVCSSTKNCSVHCKL